MLCVDTNRWIVQHGDTFTVNIVNEMLVACHNRNHFGKAVEIHFDATLTSCNHNISRDGSVILYRRQIHSLLSVGSWTVRMRRGSTWIVEEMGSRRGLGSVCLPLEPAFVFWQHLPGSHIQWRSCDGQGGPIRSWDLKRAIGERLGQLLSCHVHLIQQLPCCFQGCIPSHTSLFK